MMGVLRSDATTAPQPDLAALDELADVGPPGRPAGHAARRPAPARPVDPVVGLTTYRVVQEALTNVLRHAGARQGRRRRGRRRPRRCSSPSPTTARRCAGRRGSTGTRAGRHAGAGGDARRRPRRRARPERRVPGAGPPAARPVTDAGTAPPVRVVVADDQELVRSGFTMIVDAQPDLTVVGEAADGLEAVDVARAHARRRRADGRPHAPLRRHRGHPPHRRARRGRSGEGRHPHHLRPRRVRLRRACGPGPAASSSRTCAARISCTPSGSWPPARRCWRRRSPAG